MQPSPKPDPLVNTVLSGTYRIDRLLGKGGMGSVYAATHVHLQTACAIKVLLSEYNDNPEPLKRFQREAQITSQLGHPNIVRVTDFNFAPDGAPFMVMELLHGETLAGRLKTRGRLTLAEVVLLLGPLCDALGLAHERGVVHRDLKPENIFLPADQGLDAAKILDFGISKIRDGNTKLTQADMQMGTQSYMAPEIVCGAAAEADIRSDVFSLGAILYEVLTGQLAFDGPNAMAVMYKLMYQPPPSPRAVDPNIPEPVEAVVLHALSRKPEERTASTPELFAELTLAAMPYLPNADELEARRSNPYRFTSTAMSALRKSTGNNAQVPRSGSQPLLPPPPTPAPVLPPHLSTGPKTVLGDELQDERPAHRQRNSGALFAVIVGLVVLTALGFLVLRRRATETAVAPAKIESPAPPPALPAESPPAPTPTAPVPPPPSLPAAAEKAAEPEEAAGKKHRHHHRDLPKALPHLELPKAPMD